MMYPIQSRFYLMNKKMQGEIKSAENSVEVSAWLSF